MEKEIKIISVEEKTKEKSFINKKKNNNLNNKLLTFDDDSIKHIKINIQNCSNEDFDYIPKNKDLVPGEYEGGVKVWECSLDLCDFLPQYIGWYNLENLRVLEIGCGHGLPGLFFLLRKSIVLFQDFNYDILDKITKNYLVQINNNYDLDLSNNAGFISGDWKDFNYKLKEENFDAKEKNIFKDKKFDIIISADTIYNVNNYEYFYSIIKENLNKPGICFICSKKFYFGVGGGSSQFVDFVREKNYFDVKIIKQISNGISNIREIIEIRNK